MALHPPHPRPPSEQMARGLEAIRAQIAGRKPANTTLCGTSIREAATYLSREELVLVLERCVELAREYSERSASIRGLDPFLPATEPAPSPGALAREATADRILAACERLLPDLRWQGLGEVGAWEPIFQARRDGMAVRVSGQGRTFMAQWKRVGRSMENRHGDSPELALARLILACDEPVFEEWHEEARAVLGGAAVPPAVPPGLTSAQALAWKTLAPFIGCEKSGVVNIAGRPGTGKTYLAGKVRAVVEARGGEVFTTDVIDSPSLGAFREVLARRGHLDLVVLESWGLVGLAGYVQVAREGADLVLVLSEGVCSAEVDLALWLDDGPPPKPAPAPEPQDSARLATAADEMTAANMYITGDWSGREDSPAQALVHVGRALDALVMAVRRLERRA